MVEKPEFANNPNVHVFCHDLARDLFNDKSQVVHEMISRYQKPEEFA